MCVLAGVLASCLSTYQPALWEQLPGVLAAIAATGRVSLVHDLIERWHATKTAAEIASVEEQAA